MSAYETILKRRSIRAYRKSELTKEQLLKLLNAARMAPSARNLQPWHFIVVLDEELKRKMVPICRNQKFVGDAACLIVGLADVEASPKWSKVDVTIALEHIVLVAQELGLGTCWIGAFEENEVKKLLKIPDKFKIVAIISIGYPAEQPPQKPRKPLKEIYSINYYGNPDKPIN